MQKQKVAVQISGGLSLLRIDTDAIVARYNDGAFNTRDIPRISGYSSHVYKTFKESYGSSPMENIYVYRNTANEEITTATTNCEQFRAFNQSTTKLGGRCFYCCRDFSHQCVGIVVHISYDAYGESYYTEKIFDKFGCVFKYLDRWNINPDTKKQYVDNTAQLFDRMYPGRAIPYAMDMELLISNQGSLTDEQWDNDAHYYTQVSGVIVHPVKCIYSQSRQQVP